MGGGGYCFGVVCPFFRPFITPSIQSKTVRDIRDMILKCKICGISGPVFFFLLFFFSFGVSPPYLPIQCTPTRHNIVLRAKDP